MIGVGLVATLLAPCAPDTAEPTSERASGGTRVREVEPRPLIVDPPTPSEPKVPDPELQRLEPSIHSALTPPVVARLRAVDAESSHRDDYFAKMGGSSIQSHAFLHCFARDGDNLDLAEHASLAPTLEHFRAGRAAGSNPFSRESIAARVGWSLRQGLTGRPSRILQEVRETNARYALLFFGGNDVQGRNPRTFVERLERAMEQLLGRGVIPILGATTPRGDDEQMDQWARRFNRLSRGVAMAWQVPFVDFYQALEPLPGRGLAGDGVHPNTLLDGGRGRACVFHDKGRQHGSNQRNLRTLESLDRIHRVVSGSQGALDPEPRPLYGEGSASSPLRLVSVPYGERSTAVEATLDGYGCEGAPALGGPERVYRVRTSSPMELEVNVFVEGERNAHVVLLGADADPATCVALGDSELRVSLAAGVHHLVVEWPEAEAASATVVIDVPASDGAYSNELLGGRRGR